MMSFLFMMMFSYMFFSGSLHSLFLLLIIEFLVLFTILMILNSSMVWLCSIIFLFFSVCMSAYGVSLIVCSLREKGSFYTMSVNML